MRIEILDKKISEHIAKTQVYLERFRKNENEETLDALSFNCFQSINYLIDLGEEVARNIDENFFPSTYKDTFEFLKTKKIITSAELSSLILLVSMRNKIAHQYHVISQEDILHIASILSNLKNISKKLASSIKKE